MTKVAEPASKPGSLLGVRWGGGIRVESFAGVGGEVELGKKVGDKDGEEGGIKGGGVVYKSCQWTRNPLGPVERKPKQEKGGMGLEVKENFHIVYSCGDRDSRRRYVSKAGTPRAGDRHSGSGNGAPTVWASRFVGAVAIPLSKRAFGRSKTVSARVPTGLKHC